MKRRYVVIGLGLIAMLALATTAIAGGGIGAHASKKAKSKPGPAGPAGPPGPAGATGATGATGAPGAAKAYGAITYTSDTPTIVAAQSSNITGVSETTTGTGAGSDGFVCIDVAVPFNTAVVSPVLTSGFGVPDVSVWIPVSPGPPFTVGTCPAASDLMVLVNNSNTGTFQKGSFTIALF